MPPSVPPAVPPLRALSLLTCLALSACAAPPAGPRLLSPGEIALATQGTATPPDTAPLQIRAARLHARAAALRRLPVEPLDDRGLRARARDLARP